MQKQAGASLSGATEIVSNTTNERRRTSGLSPRHLAVLGMCALTAYGLDQATKAWAIHSLNEDEPKELIGTLLKLQLTHNPGAAFSFATNATWVLTLIAIAVIIAVLVTARKLRSLGWACAMGLVVGGALGNLTDRFVRAPGGGRGEVVDFLELPHWPIFNIADCSICTAAALVVFLTMRGIGLDGRRADNDQSKNDPAEDVA